MTLQEIEAFLAVVQYGSMTKAAESLFLTQPALSHRIAALEKELGVTLVERRKGVRKAGLTDQGRAFIEQAQKWRQLWMETTAAIAEKLPQPLTIAAVPSISSYIMPEVYRRFLAHRLPFRLKFTSPLSYEIYQRIENGEIDLAFLAYTRFSRAAATVPVIREQMVFLCGRGSDYPEQVHPSELSTDREIRFEWSNECILWHEYWFGMHTRSFVQTDSIPVLQYLIRTPNLWAVAPFSVAELILQSNGVESRQITDGPSDRLIHMVIPHASAHESFRELLLSELGDVLAGRPGLQLINKIPPRNINTAAEKV